MFYTIYYIQKKIKTMKNTLWLYKNPYQIEIREKEAHPPQVAVYLYQAKEEIKNVVPALYKLLYLTNQR